MLSKFGVPYLNAGPSAELPSFNPLILEYGPFIYEGIKGVQGFLSAWRENNLPNLEPLVN